jgi:hypothetical protein
VEGEILGSLVCRAGTVECCPCGAKMIVLCARLVSNVTQNREGIGRKGRDYIIFHMLGHFIVNPELSRTQFWKFWLL